MSGLVDLPSVRPSLEGQGTQRLDAQTDGVRLRLGIDEAGRGPLAGPVCAAAVVLPSQAAAWGLGDSKVLSAKRREALFKRIQTESLAHGLGWASVEEIDRLNILRATCLAMHRAVVSCLGTATLQGRAEDSIEIWVDGNQLPGRYLPAGDWPWPTQTLVQGDRQMLEISAASVLAKVARDAEMARLAEAFPGYGFERHNGYGTAEHLEALRTRGPSPAHRRSFGPVAQLSL